MNEIINEIIDELNNKLSIIVAKAKQKDNTISAKRYYNGQIDTLLSAIDIIKSKKIKK